VKVVGNLLEGSGWLLVAILINHVDLDVPFLHGKLGHGGFFVTGVVALASVYGVE
jgi:hypothetical protein